MPHAIPDGHHAITPHLVVKGASEAIKFYERAFGAKELSRMPFTGPDGQEKILHAALQIGDSRLFLVDEVPQQGAIAPGEHSPVILHHYVTDIDAAFARAVEAGAKVVMPPVDMFWGDRYCRLIDPFGHHWSMGEHIEDVTPEQMKERMAAAMQKHRGG